MKTTIMKNDKIRYTIKISACLILVVCICLSSVVSVGAKPENNKNEYSKIRYLYKTGFAHQNDTASHGSSGAIGDNLININVRGTSREYKLYVPVGYTPSIPVPLVIFMHSYGQDYKEGESYFSDSFVDSRDFIFCTPSANDTDWGPHWWELTAFFYWSTQFHTDALFLMEMINKTARDYNIDLSRIMVTGYSDGGTMSYRMGVFLSNILAVSCPGACDWTNNWAEPSWAQRKIPFYPRVGENDAGRPPHNQAAYDKFVAAGFEFNLDIVAGGGHVYFSDSPDKFLNFMNSRPLQHNWIRPALSFNSPVPGVKWSVNSDRTIQWWVGCGNPSYLVQLELSTNGKAGPFVPMTMLPQPTWGDGQYIWHIPLSTPITANSMLRAVITDSSSPQKTNISIMDYTFEITPDVVPEMHFAFIVSFIAIVSVVVYHSLHDQKFCS